MSDAIDIESWMSLLVEKLASVFGDRLAFVGIQGSRARNEPRQDSDIDIVVLIEGCSTQDIAEYKDILSEMPHHELACGFIASPDVLASWLRSDSMNLVLDTQPIFGDLGFMDTDFTKEDAVLSAKAGAAEIYHAITHTLAFDGDMLGDIVAACTKSAFFVMRSRVFSQTGEYPATRQRMRALADETELLFLDAYDEPTRFEPSVLADRLRDYCTHIITQ